METFSALLALCAGNSTVTGEFPTQRPVARSFDVFFDLCLSKRVSKQSLGWWSETPSCSLWRHCIANWHFVMRWTRQTKFWYSHKYMSPDFVPLETFPISQSTNNLMVIKTRFRISEQDFNLMTWTGPNKDMFDFKYKVSMLITMTWALFRCRNTLPGYTKFHYKEQMILWRKSRPYNRNHNMFDHISAPNRHISSSSLHSSVPSSTHFDPIRHISAQVRHISTLVRRTTTLVWHS